VLSHICENRADVGHPVPGGCAEPTLSWTHPIRDEAADKGGAPGTRNPKEFLHIVEDRTDDAAEDSGFCGPA